VWGRRGGGITAPMSSSWPQALWLVRHGESVGNVAAAEAAAAGRETIDVTENEDEVDLSPRGVEQAGALGHWLAGVPADQLPTLAFTSPYLRARRTGELALRPSGLQDRIRTVTDERLRDREFGILDGLTQKGVEARFPDQAQQRRRLGKFYHRPPGGESWSDVALRLRSFTSDLRRDHDGERIVVFTHDLVVLLFRYLVEGLEKDAVVEIGRQTPVRNGGVTMYELEPGGLVLRRFNAEITPDGELRTGEHLGAR
jgi:probable phosphoglycerate mutase